MIQVLALLASMVLVSRLSAADLGQLATVKPDTVSWRASSYDHTGGNADNLESFAPETSAQLLDTAGPGRINHVWLTISNFPNHETVLRDLVIRAYWEGATVPSVEVPLGDFFGLGHAKEYTLQSAPVTVGANTRALNCYWPMPFHKHARIEIYNNGRRSIRRLYYHVDYELGPQPADQGLFHALFRYERDLKPQADRGNTSGQDNYVLLETEGTGQYVGCALFIDAQPGGWWGEGDDMIFIDHSEKPVIIGTGTEDYFNNAWGFREAFCYPYYGCPLLEKRSDGGSFTGMYRWHIPDPIRFQKHLRVTLEHLYARNVTNDYSSVAYWYQLEPLSKREPLPYAEANHPKRHPVAATQPASLRIELDGTELEAELARRGAVARAITTGLGEGYTNGGYLLLERVTAPLEIRLAVPSDGTYRVRLKPVSHVLEHAVRMGFKGGAWQTFEKRAGGENRTPYVDLGEGTAHDKTLILLLDGGPTLGIDQIRIEPAGAPLKPSGDNKSGPKEENDLR